MPRFVLLVLLAAAAGCSSAPGDPPVFEGRSADLAAPLGAFTRYAFVADSTGGDDREPTATGRLLARPTPGASPWDSLSLDWDIALRGTEVILNGGANGPGAGLGVVVPVGFDAITDALQEDAFYRRDGESPCPSGPARAVCTGPGDGWFETMALPGGGQAIVPIPGRTLLLRLADGAGYAKVEFLSYYRGAPDVGAITAASEPGFYTVRFTVDPNGASFIDAE